MTRVMLTGASGFIGRHLASILRDNGDDVWCAVRPTSDRQALENLQCQFTEADVASAEEMKSAMNAARPDTIYHLAGITKAVRRNQLFETNQLGTRNLLTAASSQQTPPTVIVVSSLAASGPATAGPRTETQQAEPVSNYGRSKRAAEQEAIQASSRVPVSVVRPPIVFGPHDTDTYEMFKSIARTRLHPVPSLSAMTISWIHVQDLCRALIKTASAGRRLDSNAPENGTYFATSDQIVDYADLGKRIANVLGCKRYFPIPTPAPAVWCLAAYNELIARYTGRQNILNFDKAREATSGSWTCSGEKLRRETGFSCEVSLEQALHQSAEWYYTAGWL